MPSIIDHFDVLTERGMKIIPLQENSKIPIIKNWNGPWDNLLCRELLLKFPEANIGLLLGQIIDVEGDDNHANQTILSLIGDYPHPCYQSKKSIHHLFLTPDPQLRHFRWNKIEFRGAGHQSVLPPSQHAGVKYRWLEKFKFPIPEMPPKLISFYESKKRAKVNNLKPGHIQVWCDCCDEKIYLNEKRFHLEIEAFKLLGSKWQCHKCRPIDLRPACRLIRSGICKKVVIANTLQQF